MLLYSLIPILLWIFAGYLWWFRREIVTLLQLRNQRLVVMLSGCYLSLGGLSFCLVILQQYDWLLGLLVFICCLSAVLAFSLSRLIK